MDEADKVRENRLRRMAGRQGFTLAKSRRKDPRALGYGRYWLQEPSPDGPRAVAGLDERGIPQMTLDDTEKWLTTDHRDGTR
jgi:hypothetical protein